MSLYLKDGRECNMTHKDLAEEYLAKAKENAIYFKDGNFPNMPLFQGNDIKAAFNVGRESVVENMPELEWKNLSYEEEYYSSYSLGFSYRVMQRVNEFALFCNDYFLGRFLSIKQAKQAANEDYKQRIKQVLGL